MGDEIETTDEFRSALHALVELAEAGGLLTRKEIEDELLSVAETMQILPLFYLVWSVEHRAWWGPGGNGYVQKISAAGRYTRAAAMQICIRAMPGARREGALPELPVRFSEVAEMVAAYHATYPRVPTEPWE